MYHETWHPFEGENLADIIRQFPKHAECIERRVAEANEKKLREFDVILDADNWFKVQNGQVISSSHNE